MKEKKKTIFTNLGFVVDNETSEILEPEAQEYRIIVEELIDEPISDEMSFMANVTFIKMFRGNGIMLDKKLTYSEIAAVVFLSDFICYSDCVLRKGGNKQGHALSIDELAELRGMKYDAFRKTIYSLKNKEVLGFHNTGNANDPLWITVNPFIFCRGVKISKWVYDFYSNTEWAKIVRQEIRNRDKEAADQ